MESLAQMQTSRNLIHALTIETQAIQKYTWFAKQAKKDGYEQMSAIFLEVAGQKQSHCKTLFRFLEGVTVDINAPFSIPPVSSTLDNLKVSIATENEEANEFMCNSRRLLGMKATNRLLLNSNSFAR